MDEECVYQSPFFFVNINAKYDKVKNEQDCREEDTKHAIHGPNTFLITAIILIVILNDPP